MPASLSVPPPASNAPPVGTVWISTALPVKYAVYPTVVTGGAGSGRSHGAVGSLSSPIIACAHRDVHVTL